MNEEESHDMIFEASDDHEAITKQLEEISSMAMVDERWMAKRVLDKNAAQQMGEKFVSLKKQHFGDSEDSAPGKRRDNLSASRVV